MSQQHLLQFILPLLILVPVAYRRLARMRKAHPLKWRSLWLNPAIILVLATLVLITSPPARIDMPWLGLALLLGAVAGWYWGRSMAIEMHPQSGTLTVKGGQAAMLIFLLLILSRVGLKSGLEPHSAGSHINAVLVSDVSIVFSAGLFALRGLEMFLRARRIMHASS